SESLGSEPVASLQAPRLAPQLILRPVGSMLLDCHDLGYASVELRGLTLSSTCLLQLRKPITVASTFAPSWNSSKSQPACDKPIRSMTPAVWLSSSTRS